MIFNKINNHSIIKSKKYRRSIKNMRKRSKNKKPIIINNLIKKKNTIIRSHPLMKHRVISKKLIYKITLFKKKIIIQNINSKIIINNQKNKSQ